jgi:hypothetical protein
VRIELPEEEICEAYRSGIPPAQIAAEYEVSRSPIDRILREAGLLPGARTGRPKGSPDSDLDAAANRSHGQRLRALREKAGLLDEEASRRCPTCTLHFRGSLRAFIVHRIKCAERVGRHAPDPPDRYGSKQLPG